MTRTYVKGEPTERVQRMYQAVIDAQQAAFAVARAGVTAREVNQAAVDSILASGFEAGEAGFIHRTGHALGIDLHELPSLEARDTSTLRAGNVVTIEPGLYYPDDGGIRIEDVVVITDDGYINLTEYPKELTIA